MKTGWIRITENLPEDEIDVLIFIPEGEVNYRVAMWIDGNWTTPGMELIRANQVTHWRPLEPPEDHERPR